MLIILLIITVLTLVGMYMLFGEYPKVGISLLLAVLLILLALIIVCCHSSSNSNTVFVPIIIPM